MTTYPYLCFACGKTFQGWQSLAAHTAHCYWFHVFQDRPEDAPFYREMIRRNRLRARERDKRYHLRKRRQ